MTTPDKRIVDYAQPVLRDTRGVEGARPEVVLGWGCLSMPILLAIFSLIWLGQSTGIIAVIPLAVFVAIPSVAIGFAALPPAHRRLAVKWLLLPLAIAFAVIFFMGWTAEIA
jgi:hypothetical protein